MAFEFHLPDIGEGVVEGEIVSWKVKVGDVVRLDQPIVEIMTDKATVEIPSPRAGTIAAINYGEGQICPVGKVLLVIDDGAGGAVAAGGNGHGHAPAKAPEHSPAPQVQLAAHLPESLASAGRIEVVDATAARGRVLATPATRRLARQMGVDLARVTPTGKRGRVTSDDVKVFATAGSTIAMPRLTETVLPPARTFAPQAVASTGAEERIPFRGMRKRIAESMTRSTHRGALHLRRRDRHDRAGAVRERAKSRAADRGVKLTYLPFIVKAVVSGLKKWPMLNASLDETTQEIVRKKYYHLGHRGPGAAGPGGLGGARRRQALDLRSVQGDRAAGRRGAERHRDPRRADRLDLHDQLARQAGRRARHADHQLPRGGRGRAQDRGEAGGRGGQIVIRHLMNLSISVDHRLADGWDGAMFLQDVKALLEDPTTMFMEMV
jgi:pyruvate dehydrogenase E2 component (dihydrolipoamide acetyltransferase)